MASGVPGERSALNIGTDMGQGAGLVGNTFYSISIGEEQPTFALWPNPSSGDGFFISFSVPTLEDRAILDVYDMYGKRVASKLLRSADLEAGSLRFDERLASGMYLVTLTVGEKIYSNKAIIQ